jgi:hypothetical protein
MGREKQALPLNQVQSRSSLDNVTNFAWLQLEGSVLKLLLHIAFAKEAKVSHLSRTTAIRFTHSKRSQRCLAAANASLVPKDDAHSLLLCALNLGLKTISDEDSNGSKDV